MTFRRNGVLLWFEVSDFDAAAERARAAGATSSTRYT